MEDHPIEGLMYTAMNSIREMIDVNTIIGEPIETPDGATIIPISKVSFGFVSGGSEFKGETMNEYSKGREEETALYRLPFGGGSGAGASINPVAFLISQGSNIRLLPIEHASSVDKLIDYIPDILNKIQGYCNKKKEEEFDMDFEEDTELEGENLE